jgi:hypothetical protein
VKNIWLMGGFGNILFQVLAYRILKKTDEPVKYISYLTERNIVTNFLGWKIHERTYLNFIDKEDITSSNTLSAIFYILMCKVSHNFTYFRNISNFYNNKNKFSEPFSDNIFGYFQHKEFLEENSEELLSLCRDVGNRFRFDKSYTIVHFRCGDYRWTNEDAIYYSKVRDLIKEESNTVFIATDSPGQALNFFRECNNISLTEAKDSMTDFRYMVSAKKLYCGPSTFSWWAAHSLKNGSKVVMPRALKEQVGFFIDEDYVTIY